MSTPAHLGGHGGITHIDPGALQMFHELGCRSMLDIGCGPGWQVWQAIRMGYEAWGLDGDPSVFPNVLHDFTDGAPEALPRETFDLGWSVEFLEHVAPEFMSNFLAVMKRCKWLCVTYAPPGTSGHHHVNCQPVKFWLGVFDSAGFNYDVESTLALRAKSVMGRDFIRTTGLVFQNRNLKS